MDVMVYSPRPPCGTGYPSCGVVVFQLCVRAREEGEPVAPPLPVGQDGFPFCHTHTHIRTHTHTHTMSLCGMAILSPNPPLWNRMVSLLPYTHTPCLCQCMAILSPNPPPVEQDGFPFCSETHTHTHTPVLFSIASLLWKLRLSQGASRAGQAGYDTGAARL